MVIDCSRPVPRSLACTCRMPFASMSNDTSICGIRAGAGGSPVSSNIPSRLLYAAMSRSPWYTWICTDGWLSSAVVKICERFVGIVVLRSISFSISPPLTSMPRDSGVTSSSRTSLTSPLMTPACRAAPTATTSSGLTPLLGSLPPVRSRTRSTTAGMRGRPADEHDVVDLADGDAGVLDDVRERRLAAVEQVGRHLLELRAGDLLVQVQRALGARRDVRQVHRGLAGRGQLDLRLLRRLAQALHRHLVLGQVDAVPVLELGDQVVDDLLVPVVAAEVVVAGGGLDLDDAVADLQQRDVERATAEVEDQDRLLLLALVEPVRQGGRGGLVDDAQDVEARDLAGLLGGLALGVVEVRGDRDDGVGHGLAQVALGVPLELLQDEGADLLGGEVLAVDGHLPVGAHVALDGPDRPVDVRDGLALGDLADQDLAVLGEGDDRGRRAGALGVGDDGGLAALQDRHHGVGGAEVDADRSCHGKWTSG